jgi:hypothetical protein
VRYSGASRIRVPCVLGDRGIFVALNLMEGGYLMDVSRQCTASSKQSGERCRRAAIQGGFVCVTHGGGAPQVKLSATDRLATFVDPALTELIRIVQNGESDSVKLAAVKDVLDRTGYGAVSKQEHSGPGGGPIQIEDVSKLDDATLDALIAELSTGGEGTPGGSVTGTQPTLEAATGSADAGLTE